MARLVRSAAADEDLLAIAAYGAKQWGAESAVAFVESFGEAFELLERHPEIGRSRTELGDAIRSWLHRGYVIYYRLAADELLVARVLHGAADPAAVTGPEDI